MEEQYLRNYDYQSKSRNKDVIQIQEGFAIQTDGISYNASESWFENINNTYAWSVV